VELHGRPHIQRQIWQGAPHRLNDRRRRGEAYFIAMLILLTAAFGFIASSPPISCSGRSARLLMGNGLAEEGARVLALPRPERDFIDSTEAAPVLPELDESEEQLVQSGALLRWQQPPEKGGVGTGFAVQELHTDVDTVWKAVSAFDRYDELISTVRSVEAYGSSEDEIPNTCRFTFIASRIRLRLDVRFLVDEAQRYAAWRLDRPSWVLSDSIGYWRVQAVEGRPGVVRVWFCVSVRLGRAVPGFVVALVSRLGLLKATRWLKQLPHGNST
jgi:hypothetical protein